MDTQKHFALMRQAKVFNFNFKLFTKLFKF